MSKALQTLAAYSATKRLAERTKGVTRSAVRKGEAAVEVTSKKAKAAKDATLSGAKAALNTRGGQVITGGIDRAAGKERGIRRTAVYGAIPLPTAGLGAKKGTEGIATTSSMVGAKAGGAAGLAAGGPVGGLLGGFAGAALGGAATQTKAGLAAAKAVDRGFTKAKKAVGAKYTSAKDTVTKAVSDKTDDLTAGGRAAVGASVASDASKLFGGKGVSRRKAFRRGYKASKMHREIKEDLGTLKSLSRRGRIKPAK